MNKRSHVTLVQSVLMAGVFSMLAIAAGTEPLHNAFLQDTLNANGQSITNAGTIAATNYLLNGQPFTGGTNGAPGATGPQGPAGASGTNGAAGAAATITVGTTTTGAAGSPASVTNTGTSSAAVLSFVIPQGATGATGAAGATGATGAQGPAGTNGTSGTNGAPGSPGVVAATLPLVYNSGTQTVSTTSMTGLRYATPSAADAPATSAEVTNVIGAGVYDASGAASTAQTAATNYASTNTAAHYAGLASSNNFTANQTSPGFYSAGGPYNQICVIVGDSRSAGVQGAGTYPEPGTAYSPYGYVGRLGGQLQALGYYSNGLVQNCSVAGTGVGNWLNWYSGSSFTTTGNIVTSSNSITVTGSTSGITGNFGIGGIGIPPNTYGSISGTTITLHNGYGSAAGAIVPAGASALTPTATTTATPLDIYTNIAANSMSSPQTPHELSPAIRGVSGGHLLFTDDINDVTTTTSTWNATNGSANITITNLTLTPLSGFAISGTGIPSNTTISSVSVSGTTTTVTMSANFTGTTGSVSVTITPNASSIETAIAAHVSLALADSYQDILCTTPKAWSGAWNAGDSIRLAVNSWMLSTYGTTPLGNGAYSGTTSGVYVIDAASMPIWSTFNLNYYLSDGLHFTTFGEQLWASYISQGVSTIFGATGNPMVLGAPMSIPANSVQPYVNLVVDPFNYGGSIKLGSGNANQTDLVLGGLTVQNNQGSNIRFYYGSGSNILTFPWGSSTTSGTVLINITAQTAALTAQSSVGTVIALASPSAGTYNISGAVNVTAISTDVIELEVTYTDENSNAQTQLLYPLGQTSALLSSTGDYVFPSFTIRTKSGSPITLKTIDQTGGGTQTFDAYGSIQAAGGN